MIVLNIIMYATMSVMVAVVTMQVCCTSIFYDMSWIVDAQNTIKNSLLEVEMHGVDNAYIKSISNAEFDVFTTFVEKHLSEIINQINANDSEEMAVLKMQLIKWSNGLAKLNNEYNYYDKTPKKSLQKFLVTIDFVINEVYRFLTQNQFESPDANNIIKELKILLKMSVDALTEHAESVKIQVSGLTKFH